MAESSIVEGVEEMEENMHSSINSVNNERHPLLQNSVVDLWKDTKSLRAFFWTCNFFILYPVLHGVKCEDSCQYSLVESIPTEMNISHLHSLPSHEVIIHMLKTAKSSVRTMQFYFNLENDAVPEARGDYGNDVYKAYLDAAKRGIDVHIIYNQVSNDIDEDVELKSFRDAGIKVDSFDFQKYFGGVLHSKVIIVDETDFYLGSLNMDWKSFSQVKEMGIYVRNCKCLAEDVNKVFNVMKWYLKDQQVDEGFDTSINANTSMNVKFEYIDDLDNWDTSKLKKSNIFISASPVDLNTKHRTSDIDSLLYVMKRAEKFVYVSVMDFLPFMMYNSDEREYWGVISDELKNSMVKRNVEIRLLISRWNHTMPMQYVFLRELNVFGKICVNSSLTFNNNDWCSGRMEVREFAVPDAKLFHPQYNFTRVNHAKFMVTDKDVFISTSNWCKDYFFDTAGMSVSSDNDDMRRQLVGIFKRDWNSQYSHKIQENECKED